MKHVTERFAQPSIGEIGIPDIFLPTVLLLFVQIALVHIGQRGDGGCVEDAGHTAEHVHDHPALAEEVPAIDQEFGHGRKAILNIG